MTNAKPAAAAATPAAEKPASAATAGKGKRTAIAKKAIAEDLSGVTLSFSDGKNLVVLLSKLTKEMVTHLALHGLSQKLGDSYSGEKDVVVARTKATNVGKRLLEGNWAAIREGGGSRISELAQALARATGRTVEAAVDVIEKMDKDGKKALRANAQVKAAIFEIRKEKAEEAAKEAAAEAGAEKPQDLNAMFG